MPWQRVNHRQPCPICGRPNWCTYTADGKLAHCMRASAGLRPSTNRHGEPDGGWIVRVADGQQSSLRATPKQQPARELGRAEIELIYRQHVANVFPARLNAFARSLCVSVESLRAVGIGWDTDKQAWTFPMRDDRGIAGLRYRRDTGAKWSLAGGHEGLFRPALTRDGIIIVCEGPTSAAAWLDLGFDAIGMPSCRGGTGILKAVVRSLDRPLLIVADRDSAKKRPNGDSFCPGPDGARALYESICGVCRAQWAVCPVPKDGRDWLRRGATHGGVHQWIQSLAAEVNIGSDKYSSARTIDSGGIVTISA